MSAPSVSPRLLILADLSTTPPGLMPKTNRDVLEVVFLFLDWLSKFAHISIKDGNLMDLSSIATVMAPTLLRPHNRDARQEEVPAMITSVLNLLEDQKILHGQSRLLPCASSKRTTRNLTDDSIVGGMVCVCRDPARARQRHSPRLARASTRHTLATAAHRGLLLAVPCPLPPPSSRSTASPLNDTHPRTSALRNSSFPHGIPQSLYSLSASSPPRFSSDRFAAVYNHLARPPSSRL